MGMDLLRRLLRLRLVFRLLHPGGAERCAAPHGDRRDRVLRRHPAARGRARDRGSELRPARPCDHARLLGRGDRDAFVASGSSRRLHRVRSRPRHDGDHRSRVCRCRVDHGAGRDARRDRVPRQAEPAVRRLERAARIPARRGPDAHGDRVGSLEEQGDGAPRGRCRIDRDRGRAHRLRGAELHDEQQQLRHLLRVRRVLHGLGRDASCRRAPTSICSCRRGRSATRCARSGPRSPRT